MVHLNVKKGLAWPMAPAPRPFQTPVEILKDESTAAKARIAALIGVLPSLCYKWNAVPDALVERSAASYVQLRLLENSLAFLLNHQSSLK
jgi:hypothetical protein